MDFFFSQQKFVHFRHVWVGISVKKSSPCVSFLLKCIVKNPLTQVVWWAAVGRTKGGVSFSFHCSESRANEIHSINSSHASHEILEFFSLSLLSDDEDLILPIYLQSWLLFPKAHSEKYVCSIYVFRFPSYISALFLPRSRNQDK